MHFTAHRAEDLAVFKPGGTRGLAGKGVTAERTALAAGSHNSHSCSIRDVCFNHDGTGCLTLGLTPFTSEQVVTKGHSSGAAIRQVVQGVSTFRSITEAATPS